MTNLKLVPAAEYYNVLQRTIPLAKRRIVLMAMGMVWDEKTEPIFQLLIDAQKRGVGVYVLYDRYSWLPFAFHRWLPSRAIRRKVLELTAFSDEIEAAGGIVNEVGKKWALNPFAHRMHAKITLVDDNIYSFGGVNFTGESFDYADYMFLTPSAPMADALAELGVQIAYNRELPDQELLLNDNSIVLFDGGKPGKSIIYEHACELAERATQIMYVSQMCPSGRLAQALKGKSTCYFNTPALASGPGKIGNIIDQARYGVKNHYKGQTYIHAKFILYKMQDGSRVLLSGSNNFSWRGIRFGTKEIALQSGNPILWDELAHFLQIKIIGA